MKFTINPLLEILKDFLQTLYLKILTNLLLIFIYLYYFQS